MSGAMPRPDLAVLPQILLSLCDTLVRQCVLLMRSLWTWLEPGRRSMFARRRALPPRVSRSSPPAWGGPRVPVGFGPSLRDLHDGCGRCPPGLWQLASRCFSHCTLWSSFPAFPLRGGLQFDHRKSAPGHALVLVDEFPCAPEDVVCLQRRLEGRLSRGRHPRRQVAWRHRFDAGLGIVCGCNGTQTPPFSRGSRRGRSGGIAVPSLTSRGGTASSPSRAETGSTKVFSCLAQTRRLVVDERSFSRLLARWNKLTKFGKQAFSLLGSSFEVFSGRAEGRSWG